MIEIRAFEPADRERAAQLVRPDFTGPELVAAQLRGWAKLASGIVALRDGRFAGFMLGIVVPIEGVRTPWISDVGHGVDDPEPDEILRRLYATWAAGCAEEGHGVHHVTVLESDMPARATLGDLGFGTFSVDALRSLDPIEPRPDLEIRRADPVTDFHHVMELQRSLHRHLRAAPIFVPAPPDGEPERRRRWLAEPSVTLWLALVDGRVVGGMACEPPRPFVLASAGEHIRAITMASTLGNARRGGVARALLARVLDQAREEGCDRCYVDFESANHEALSFWTRQGFRIVSRTLRRRIDPRVVPPAS